MNTRIHDRLVNKGHQLLEPPEERKSFFKWFRESVLGLDSDEYVEEFWREARKGHTIGHYPRTLDNWYGTTSSGMYDPSNIHRDDGYLVALVLCGPSLVFWLIRELISQQLRKERRPGYYEAERLRRLELGHIRRTFSGRKTLNPCPTLDAIRAAWNGARHSPEGALRLGGLLEDLECYVDNRSIAGEDGFWRGRRGGIKRFLEREAHDLFEHYAALMRYKSIARRFRQACSVDDPVPTNALLPPLPNQEQSGPNKSSNAVKQGEDQGTTSPNKSSDTSEKVEAKDTTSLHKSSNLVTEKERKVAMEVLAEAGGTTVIALEAAIALRIDPNCIADPDSIESSNSSDASDNTVSSNMAEKKKTKPLVSSRIVAWLRHRRGCSAA